jgi:hypothetical protein
MNDIRSIGRSILILAAAFVVAVIVLKALAIIWTIVFNLVTLLVLAGVVWIVFLLARSEWNRHQTAER